jgi:G3E family GTPase
MDDQCKTHMRLDSVLTVVDSKHFPLHLAIKEKNINEKKKISAHGEEISEVIQQIAYADRILINKLDLINESELENVIKSITEINPTAQLITCQHSKVPIERLLNIRYIYIQYIYTPCFSSYSSSYY